MTATASGRTAPAPAGVARLLAGVGGAPTLDRHLALYGPLPRRRDLIETIEAAALHGRGGAGFPTAVKLAAVARATSRPIVVANGAEGEPTSKKDRALLRVAPHLVLDGVSLAADAVGAREALVAVSRPAPELVAAAGERLRNRVDRVEVEVKMVPHRFVAGEETALVRALEDRPAKPTLKPPYPFERGVGGAPTLVQNVETLAHIALIARFGAPWFGTGTALVTLSGAVAQPGVHEIALGSTLADAVQSSGGLAAPVAAYLVGGYFGRFVAAADADALRLTPDVLGAGALVAIPSSTCIAAEVAAVVRYLAGESAGQCGPCIHGLAAIADTLDVGRRGDRRAEVSRLAGLVNGRGACRHPDGVARLVSSALEVFADEYARHSGHRGCGRRFERVLAVPGRKTR
jgi:NADH:ubiquinone oxidoreductase subunit F (NADH-binding)